MSDLKTNQKTVLYFWNHARRYPWLLVGMIVLLPPAMLTNGFLPAYIAAGILDRLAKGDYIAGDVWGSFGVDILTAVGLAVLGGFILWRLQIYCNWQLEARVQRDVRREVFNELQHQSASFHANHFGGSLTSATHKLVESYRLITDATVYHVMMTLTALTFTSILLWDKARWFVLILILLSAICIIGAVFLSKRMRYHNRRTAETDNKVTGQLADSLTNVLAIKSFAGGDFENKRFEKTTNSLYDATRQLIHSTLTFQTGINSINTAILLAALLGAVIGVVMYGAEASTVFLAVAYTNIIRERLWIFGNEGIRNYSKGFGDAQEMIDILAKEPVVKDPVVPEKPTIKQGEIHFDNVVFAHAEAKNDALFNKLNLTIRPGEKVGLVGHSGAGKTTLTKLLLRYDDIDEGAIRIDGQNIAHLRQDDLRRYIAYVPQEPLLFHRSIRENIAYGKPGASQAEIDHAAKQAHAAEFIEKLPHGYDTLVGERGIKLSGGQRQRIAIARTLLKDAPILVLDEATSALDSESERLIQDAVWKLMENRTAIVVAHRLSTIQKMDTIIVMDNGTIIEHGSHADLLNKKGVYAKLWTHQSGGFLES